MGYCRVTPAEPSVVERAVRRRHSGVSVLWMLATGPIADTHAIDSSLGLASVRPAGVVPSPRRVQLQSIITSSEHGTLASGRTESSFAVYLVDTLGTGPIADIHVVNTHLSTILHDLSIRHLSGRSDGKLLSSDSDRAIGGRATGAKAPQRYFYIMDVGYGTHSRHLCHRCTPFGFRSAYRTRTVTGTGAI